MRISIDSSSFAKRYVHEVGSETLGAFLQQTSEIGLCIILVPEIISGLNRRLREGALAKKDYRNAKSQLLNDVRDATILQITPAVISRSVILLESNVLRAMDALHVACALEWKTDLFVTSDRRQFNVAIDVGLQTEFI